MVEVKVLAIVAPLLEGLKLHGAKKCPERDHALIDPELGCMDIESNAVPDAAVYTCRSGGCEWRRKDPLKR